MDKFEEEQAKLKASNEHLTREFDILMQEKLLQNCYVAGLAEEDLKLQGFVKFASVRLGIQVQEWHIKSVYRVKQKMVRISSKSILPTLTPATIL